MLIKTVPIDGIDAPRICSGKGLSLAGGVRPERLSIFDDYTTMWYYYIVVFIESAAFSRRLRALVGSEEGSTLQGIQNELVELPSRGNLVPGLGGIRKARFGNPGRRKGKRGGFLLLDKDEQADLSNEERAIIRAMVTELKKAGGTK